jgi:hypothetical protein
MRRGSFLLPALSMGLIYGSISFGMIVLNLRDSGKFDGNLAGPVHFILALAGGLGLYCAASRSNLLRCFTSWQSGQP